MTGRGKFVVTLIILAVVGVGVFQWSDWFRRSPAPVGDSPAAAAGAGESGGASSAALQKINDALLKPETGLPPIEPAATYIPKDNTVDLDFSEWAGYAGLIVANGGLEPNENSFFFKNFGFKVRIKLSEEDHWSDLNAGRFAASGATVDVLAAMPRSFQAVVPLQIDFSRGADGVVVRKGIRRINDLKGKVLVTAQFTEADFFIRFLAQEAGLAVNMLASLSDRPAPDKLNLVFAEDSFEAGDLFLEDLENQVGRLDGCVTWEPKTTQVAEASKGEARILATNRNLLIVADVLVVNKGFAAANPAMVAGLVEGILYGNAEVRANPDAHLDTVGGAFKWSRDQTRAELSKVFLSNLPENLAFFSGAMDAGGSFGYIYQSAILAYGDLIKEPTDPERYADQKVLLGLQAAGKFAAEKAGIVPLARRSGATENDPLLSKDIRFLFMPNSSELDLNNKYNVTSLDAISRLLKISPGSTILLRGHVDNARVAEFRNQGGDTLVRQMSLQAMQLSKDRASEIRRVLIERLKVDSGKLETVGRGWEEPAGTDPDLNRRVEVQWFLVE